MDGQPLIGIKQLHKDLPKVAEAVRRGKSFIVMKHAKPLFRIEPIQRQGKKKYTFEDMLKIRFRAEKNLSKKIDHYVYGV